MKKIEKQLFDELLQKNKDSALALLRDDSGEYYDTICLTATELELEYRVAKTVSLHDESPVRQIVLADIAMHSQMKYTKFNNWYFLGKVELQEAEFTDKASFVDAIFAEEANFNNVTFNKNVSFWGAFFLKDAHFMMAYFNGVAEFISCRFLCDFELNGAVFAGKCLFSFNELGGIVNFTGASSRAEMIISVEQLCRGNRLAYPSKLVRVIPGSNQPYLGARDNLHALRQMLGKNAYGEEEDHIYYWYKVFSRRSRPIAWYEFITRPLEILVLDKASGYFLKPGRVLLSMLTVLFVYFFFYFISSICCTDFIGCLVDANNNPIHQNQCLTQAITNVEIIRDFVYFDLITFTTIGYGDLHPNGWLRLFAGMEGLIGVLLMSLFMVTATKKVLGPMGKS